MKAISRIHRGLFGKIWDCKSVLWLSNHTKVINYISENPEWKKSTKMDYFKSITAIVGRLKGYDELYKIYNAEMMALKVEVDDQKSNNMLSEQEKKNYLDWKTIYNYEDPTWDSRDIFLHTLSTRIPPMRLVYNYLKLIRNKKKKEISKIIKNKDWNYLILNKNNVPVQMIINRYKNSKYLGVFKINLLQHDNPPLLNFSAVRNDFRHYFQDPKYNLNSGTLLFGTQQGGVYNTFTTEYNRLYKNTGKKISTNILRHSIISWVLSQNPTNRVKNELAKYMRHSTTTQDLYRKDVQQDLDAIEEKHQKNKGTKFKYMPKPKKK